MSGFDPIIVEHKFNETVRLINSSPSERIQITCINQFIQEVWEFRTKVTSYLEQLIQYLPNVSSPLLLAGVDPSVFEGFIDRIQIISEEIDSDIADEKVSEYRTGLLMLRSWLGERPDEGTGNVIQLDGWSKPDYKPGEVLIPVVEQLKTSVGSTGIGRLRQLRVDILGENKKGKSELKPAFGVIGKDTGSFLKGVALCAEKLLSVSKKGKHKHWKATASLSMSHAWHAGRSANLALAAAFYCEMLKAEEMAEFFRLNPAVCVSGDVDEFGNVLAVEEESLELKTEAAFFSWVQVLVVPAAQLNQVQQKITKLKERFPKRELPLFGVNKIEEIFYDRRLTIHHKTDAIIHNFRRMWKRKFSVASVITMLVLLGIIARLVYGPVDRNPTYVTYEGEFAHIRNSAGATLESIEIGERYVNYIKTTSAREVADHIKLIDLDGDGTNEILENNTSVDHPEKKENFVIRNTQNDTLLNQQFILDVRFDKHPYVKEGLFIVRKFTVGDINGDGINELILILSYSVYFTNLLAVVNLETQEIELMYVNSGYIRDLFITDLENDGFKDILLAVELKSIRDKGFVVLDSRFIHGTGVLGERYKKSDMDKAIEKAVIVTPQTKVGEILTQNNISRNVFMKGFPDFFSSLNSEIFTFFVRDWYQSKGEGARIMFEFYNDLSVRSIVSQDSYDIKAKELFDSGAIDFEPDALFLDTYRDSLKYWNGTEFQSEPTLNKKYLEAVGEDSMFYKEFYFKNNE